LSTNEHWLSGGVHSRQLVWSGIFVQQADESVLPGECRQINAQSSTTSAHHPLYLLCISLLFVVHVITLPDHLHRMNPKLLFISLPYFCPLFILPKQRAYLFFKCVHIILVQEFYGMSDLIGKIVYNVGFVENKIITNSRTIFDMGVGGHHVCHMTRQH